MEMSSPEKQSPSSEARAGPSSGSPTRQDEKVSCDVSSLPSPIGSPPSSPRQRINSVFANVCPRMSTDDIVDIIYEESYKMVQRKELPPGFLNDPNILFDWDHLVKLAEAVLSKRDLYLQVQFNKVLNAKLSEQHEILVNELDEDLREQFKNASDPSYIQ